MKITKIAPEYWEMGRLQEVLKGFEKKKILVIGDVGVDRYAIGLVERISPEAPVPIVLIEQEKHKLGLAANVADNVCALRGRTLLVGVVGRDDGAKLLGKLLSRAGADSKHLVPDSSRRTVFKERIVSGMQQLLRVDYETQAPVTDAIRKKVLAKATSLLSQVDGVVIQDYAKGLLSEELCHQIYQRAKKKKKWVIVDPNSKSPLSFYRGAYLVKPNKKEAEALVGFRFRNEEDLIRAGRMLLSKTKSEHVIITLGKEGMALFSRSTREVLQIPTYAQEVFDVSGAGDTVTASLALALAAGASLSEAAILSNLASGVVVGKLGTATCTPAEIMNAMTRVKGGL